MATQDLLASLSVLSFMSMLVHRDLELQSTTRAVEGHLFSFSLASPPIPLRGKCGVLEPNTFIGQCELLGNLYSLQMSQNKSTLTP
jgi:hypothetical protein